MDCMRNEDYDGLMVMILIESTDHLGYILLISEQSPKDHQPDPMVCKLGSLLSE
jgi:hypothetical protein